MYVFHVQTIGARQNYQNVLQAKDNALISSDG